MRFEGKKIGNKGFTFIEVLVATIILAIISVPLVRAFSTSYRTNYKAKLLMKSTTAAENLIEEFRYTKLDDLIDKYNQGSNVVTEVTTDKTYRFQIKESGDFRETLPDDYVVDVLLDADAYPNANSLNAGEYGGVSIEDSAIFTMDTDYDEDVYQLFVDRNNELATNSPHIYGDIPNANLYFRKNLKRTITIDVMKVGTLETAEGDTIDAVQATLKIDYEAPSTKYEGVNILTEGDLTYTKTDVIFFDNAVTKKELNGVYIFFNPRCYAASLDNSKDVVIVNNPKNLDFNLYLVAQQTFASEQDEQRYPLYKSNKGLNVTVNEVGDGGDDSDAHITLRSNLCTGAPYSTDIDTPGESNCTLTYSRGSSVKYNDAAQKALHCGAVDGRDLNPDEVNNRIYKIKVNVYDGDPDECIAAGVRPIVEIDGTKLE